VDKTKAKTKAKAKAKAEALGRLRWSVCADHL